MVILHFGLGSEGEGVVSAAPMFGSWTESVERDCRKSIVCHEKKQ